MMEQAAATVHKHQNTSKKNRRKRKSSKAARKKKWNERIIVCLLRSVPSSFQLDSFTLIGVRFYCFIKAKRARESVHFVFVSFSFLPLPNAQFVRPTTYGGLACFMSFRWWAASRGHTRKWNIITARWTRCCTKAFDSNVCCSLCSRSRLENN